MSVPAHRSSPLALGTWAIPMKNTVGTGTVPDLCTGDHESVTWRPRRPRRSTQHGGHRAHAPWGAQHLGRRLDDGRPCPARVLGDLANTFAILPTPACGLPP